MGNENAKTRQRNSYSFDTGDFNNFKTDKILPLNLSQSKYSKNHNKSSLDIPKVHQNQLINQISSQIHHSIYQSQQKPKLSIKEQNIKLQKLTKNNDELRKQLMQINKKLSEQLKKKKSPPILMIQHHNNKNKSQRQSKSLTKQQEKKDKIKVLALKKQLQNAYNQVTRYQKQIEELKKGHSSSEKTDNQIVVIQDKIHQVDIEIIEKTKQVQSLKSVLEKQNNIINEAEEELNSREVRDSKKQIVELKQKLKILKQIGRKKEKDEKVRHQILLQLQRKLREINGQYMPAFINYSLRDPTVQEVKNNLKESLIRKKLLQKNGAEFRYLPSSLEIQQVEKQVQKYKQNHEQFHRKIDFVLKRRNQLRELKQRINEKLFVMQKRLQNLLYKKQRYTQLIMGNMQIGGNFDDNFSDDGQENSLNEQKIIKSFGNDLAQQKQYNDLNLFNNLTRQKFKIVTVNIWLNQKNQIVSLQFYYTEDQNFIVGNKIGQNKNVEEKKVFELEQGDYLRNVMGIFNANTKFLQFLVLESFKGKVMKFGKEILKGDNFNFKIGKKQKLSCFSGACTFDGNYYRINKISFQITNL